ncbi:BREX-1 system adenine-specific DNA-methyltransferase PglX [Lachnospiraceae bacterium LCP25S3_G4]
MNKTAIKNFAIEARKKIIASVVTEAGFYGITVNGCNEPKEKGNGFEVYKTIAGTDNQIFGDTIKQRASLATAVKEKGFDNVMEEVSYTWFNRIIAIRFMEINGYLPTRVRVLSSETKGKSEPDLVSMAPDVDLEFSDEDKDTIYAAKEENRYDDLFRMLFLKQCNALNEILPELFENTSDYTELLLKLSYVNEDSVVRILVDTVPEEDFNIEAVDENGQVSGQVEIIGWMYQYYNSELKDETFALLKKNVKITKDRIPAATQLFTPDWIVRYMVENSVGRLWIEHLRANDDSVVEKEVAEQFGWKYYLPEAEQETDVNVKLAEIRTSYKDMTPLDIKCIDPCMGSGHILVYMFDVLISIYVSAGYSEKDAAFYIIQYNLHGLDIDKRAYQLSYFAIMMKGRSYNRRLFKGRSDVTETGEHIHYAHPNVYAIKESNSLPLNVADQLNDAFPEVFTKDQLSCIQYVRDVFFDAREYGSILNVDSYCDPDREDRQYASVAMTLFSLYSKNHEYCRTHDLNIPQMLLLDDVCPLLDNLMFQALVMCKMYDVVVTNPPYMSSAGMDSNLLKYVKQNYDNGRNDLYTVFIIHCKDMCKKNGYISMITQLGWMSLTRSEQLREYIYDSTHYVNMLHLGSHIFEDLSGEVVKSGAFVFRKKKFEEYHATYCKLDGCSTNDEKENCVINKLNAYSASLKETNQIEGSPMSFWLPRTMLPLFESSTISSDFICRAGMQTGNNELFLRFWYEPSTTKIDHFMPGTKWYGYNKGGSQRKWTGNTDLVVNWENDGTDIKAFKKYRLELGEIEKKNSECWNSEYYFVEGITWSSIASGAPMFRYTGSNTIFDIKGPTCFAKENTSHDDLLIVMGFLNSPIVKELLNVLSPTLDCNPGTVSRLPFIKIEEKDEILDLVKNCMKDSDDEWNSYETSQNFIKHPLIDSGDNVSNAFNNWTKITNERFIRMKQHEESLNEIFVNKYGLKKVLTTFIDDKEITIRKSNLIADIKGLLSYAVGCMFGRYSLVLPGIVYAGGNWPPQEKGLLAGRPEHCDQNISSWMDAYGPFCADVDNVIPITDEEYFEDDIVGRVVEFVRTVYGADTLEENLLFIASALGNKGNSSREIIRNYFVKDFFKDHCKIYQKRPIYWLFDSGKENGFKALIYMHRYEKDTVGRVRADYLHKTQEKIENALRNADDIITNSTSATDRAQATKNRNKYIKQLNETRIYDQALAHIAHQRIEIDLDDGVKHNYELFQGIETVSESGKKQKIDLLAII